MKKQLLEHKWSYVFLFCFNATLSLASLQRFSLKALFPMSNLNANIYFHDLLIGVLLLSFLSTRTIRKKVIFIFKKYWQASFLFAWIGIATIFSTDHLISAPLFYWIRLGYYLAFATSLHSFFQKQKYKKYHHLTFFFVLYTLLSLVLYIIFPDTRFLKILGWDDHYYRLVGTILDPNFSGILLSLSSFWLVEHMMQSNNKRHQKVYFLAAIISIVALGLTFSRSSYLAWLIGSSVLTLLEKKKKQVILMIPTGIIIVLFTLLLAPKPGGEGVNLLRTSTVESRLDTAKKPATPTKNSLQLMLGSGFAFTEKNPHPLFANTQHAFFPDNFFIMLYNAIGLVGLCFVSYLVFKHKASILHQSSLLPYVAALLTHSMFNNTILQPIILLISAEIVIEHLKKNRKVSERTNVNS